MTSSASTLWHALALCCAVAAGGQRVAEAAHGSISRVMLHAQGLSSAGTSAVFGSEMTCRGYTAAFEHILTERDGALEGGLPHTRIVSPYNYASLSERWDLLLIEGFFFQFTALVHEFRARNPRAVVLFLNFDPQLPGQAEVARMDVDGVLSNSAAAVDELAPFVPARYTMLAANVPAEDARDLESPGTPPPGPALLPVRYNVVYVGGEPQGHKPMLYQMLREAIPFGLVIYGSLWEQNEEFRPYWRGPLPADELDSTYRSTHVALGGTLDYQARAGMVNNRVFEVLHAGCVLVTDHFPALEDALGDAPIYIHGTGETTRHLRRLLGEPATEVVPTRSAEALDRARRGHDVVRSQHTYVHRARDILGWAEELRAAREATEASDSRRPGRANPTYVGVLFDGATAGPFSPTMGPTLWRALSELRTRYRIELVDVTNPQLAERVNGQSETLADSQLFDPYLSGSSGRPDPLRCAGFDIVLVVGQPGGLADRVARDAAREDAMLRDCTRRILSLTGFDEDGWAWNATHNDQQGDPLGFYDAVMYRTPEVPAGLRHRGAIFGLGFTPTGDELARCPPPSPMDSDGTPSALSGCVGVQAPPVSMGIARASDDIYDVLELDNATRQLHRGLPYVYVGRFSSPARTGWIARLRGLRLATALFPVSSDPDAEGRQIADVLRSRGVAAVTGGIGADEMVSLLCSTRMLYVPGGEGDSGVVATAMAQQLGATIYAEDDARMVQVLRTAQVPSTEGFAHRLVYAMRWSFTQGRGRSRIDVVAPRAGDVVPAGSPVEVVVRFSHFSVGADGEWCLNVSQTVDSHTEDVILHRCIMVAVFRPFAVFEWPAGAATTESEIDVNVDVWLRGNVYSNELAAPSRVAFKVSKGLPAQPLRGTDGEAFPPEAQVPREFLVFPAPLRSIA